MVSFATPRNPKYGWIPDLPDQRDIPYIRLAIAIPKLPVSIDLRAYCSPIKDQGKLGSCTAFALTGSLELLKKISLKKAFDFSELFLYYNERVIEHTQRADSGASLRDGIKTLAKAGDCLEEYWPYKINRFKTKPSKQAYRDGLNYQILKYYRLYTIEEMKHTVSAGYPFVFGFAVYESFESKAVKKTGIVPMPKSDERMIGGHAVCTVGYDDAKQWFIVRNSWGDRWGDHGYFYMPYAYVTNRFLSADFWTIRDME